MNKKQLIVTSILVSLMFVLVVAQSFFTENFKNANSVNKSINECTQYKINEKEYIISIPSKWSVQEENNDDSYISHRLRFKGIDEKINGILEVINTNSDVEAFANKDLKEQSLKYSDSQMTNYTDTNNTGILIKYNTSIKNGYNYKNQCYYIKLSENQIVKILFNIKNEGNEQNNSEICNSIISSIKQDK